MEGLYSKERHLRGVRKFEECDRLSRRIWERNKRKRNTTGKEEKRKIEGNRDRIESRSRGVQEKWITGEVYSKNFVWMRW